MDPGEFAAAVRGLHARRRANPHGWPWTSDAILSEGYFLDDLRDLHFVTAELLREAVDLPKQGKIELAIAVRYRQSARGAAARYAQAIKDGTLAAAIKNPCRSEAMLLTEPL